MASNRGLPSSPSQGPSSTGASARSSRQSSISTQQHLPAVPSGLRQAHMPPSSPEDHQHEPQANGHAPEVEADGIHPFTHDYALHPDTSPAEGQAAIDEPNPSPDARTRLLDEERKYNIPKTHNCGEGEGCTHGAFSPRPRYSRGYGSFATYGTARSEDSREGYGGPYNADRRDDGQREGRTYRGDFIEGALGDAVTDGLLGKPGKKSTTHWLAKRHGVRHERIMYVTHTLQNTHTNHSSPCLL